jgi:hypothetical protein
MKIFNLKKLQRVLVIVAETAFIKNGVMKSAQNSVCASEGDVKQHGEPRFQHWKV